MLFFSSQAFLSSLHTIIKKKVSTMDEFYPSEPNENSQDNIPEETNEAPPTGEETAPVADFEHWEAPRFYEEHVAAPTHTRKKVRRGTAHPVLLCLLSALLSALLCFGSTLAYFSLRPAASGSTERASGTAAKTVSMKEDAEPGDTLSTAAIAQKVGPSVVGIVSTVKGFTFFYNQETSAKSSGSGIIISEDGYIMTNNHVISGASSVQVILQGGETYDATLVGTDPDTDLAVIKIEATGLTPATLGDSDSLQVGEKAVAIGNPLGTDLAGTVTQGIVSALNRSITVDNVTYNLIQIDAAINSGNSGGALANGYGEVIGINSVKISSEGVEGLGFAIPINDAKPIIEDLMAHGYVTGRPLIGLTLREITEEVAYYNNLPVKEGLYVTEVTEGTGADLAGIRRGDIITACDGKAVATVSALNEIRDTHKAGDTVTLTVNRDGKNMEIKVTLSEKKATFTP